jgi:hypothetical protein
VIGRVSFTTIDATDPDRLAAFWGEILGTEVAETSDEGRFVFLAEANGHILSFQFARDAPLKTTIFLYDRAGKTMERLVSLDLTKYYVAPGAVGERYATWSVCGPRTCNAFIRDTDTDQTEDPRSRRKPRYAPMVDEAEGLVYFVRSGPTCGSTVRIMRLALADLAAARSVCSPCRSGSTSAVRGPSSTWERGSISGSLATAVPRSRATSTGSGTWGRPILSHAPAAS